VNIEKYIPFGHENAVKQETLMELTGLNDRALRREIANSKAIILSLHDGKGYFQLDPHSKAEREFAKKYSAQEKATGWSYIKKALRVDKKLSKTRESEFNGNQYQMARLLVGLSREAVAGELGISIRKLSLIENGHFDFTETEKESFEKLIGFEL